MNDTVVEPKGLIEQIRDAAARVESGQESWRDIDLLEAHKLTSSEARDVLTEHGELARKEAEYRQAIARLTAVNAPVRLTFMGESLTQEKAAELSYLYQEDRPLSTKQRISRDKLAAEYVSGRMSATGFERAKTTYLTDPDGAEIRLIQHNGKVLEDKVRSSAQIEHTRTVRDVAKAANLALRQIGPHYAGRGGNETRGEALKIVTLTALAIKSGNFELPQETDPRIATIVNAVVELAQVPTTKRDQRELAIARVRDAFSALNGDREKGIGPMDQAAVQREFAELSQAVDTQAQRPGHETLAAEIKEMFAVGTEQASAALTTQLSFELRA